MLDRSIWNFPGAGDTVSSSSQFQEGVTNSTSTQFSANIGISGTTGVNAATVATTTIEAGLGLSTQTGMSLQAQYSNNDAFSSQNTHVGISCRRSITDNQTTQLVSLTVYRTTDDGVQAETITVNINLEKARSGATFR
jgi:hypothetical protein